MKQRGILFSAPMIRALLAGTKTQTRRVAKPQPIWEHTRPLVAGNAGTWWLGSGHRGIGFAGYADAVPQECCDALSAANPYGVAGSRLWVRESWRADTQFDALPPRDIPPGSPTFMEASASNWRGGPHDGEPGKLRPGIFMPRWASRIALEITEVRVERLQAISESDALAEGIVPTHGGFGLPDGSHFHAADPRQSYFGLFEAINGPGSVEANPWLWVVVFRRVR